MYICTECGSRIWDVNGPCKRCNMDLFNTTGMFIATLKCFFTSISHETMTRMYDALKLIPPEIRIKIDSSIVTIPRKLYIKVTTFSYYMCTMKSLINRLNKLLIPIFLEGLVWEVFFMNSCGEIWKTKFYMGEQPQILQILSNEAAMKLETLAMDVLPHSIPDVLARVHSVFLTKMNNK